MEMIRFNIEYDLLLQKTKLSSNTIKNNEISQPINKVYFLICNSCYWCASYFGIDKSLYGPLTRVLDCHVCKSRNTELIPVSTDELFRIECRQTSNMD